jgi:uncharacterized coiled-coil protein SlyX
VANLEARVTTLEGQAERQDTTINGLRADISHMRSEMATRSDIADIRRDMGEFRSEVNHRIDLLDAKFDRHFMWLTGIMMSGFITMLGAIVAVVFQLNSIR